MRCSPASRSALRASFLLLTVLATAAPGARPAQAADVLDWLHARALLHLQREGPWVPLTGEGLRKHVQEYGQPWGAVVMHDGQSGRVLTAPSATLTLPASAGAARLRLRVHGLASGQKLSVHVNGQLLKNAELSAAWQVLDLDLPAGRLRAGENAIRLTVARKAPVPGAQSYALWHSLELLPESAPADAGAPASWPAAVEPRRVTSAGKTVPALVGARSYALLVEVPARATLTVQTGVTEGQVPLRITAETSDGKRATLLDATQGPGWQARSIGLDAQAGGLVRLVLETPDLAAAERLAWGEPRITLASVPAVKVPTFRHVILLVVDALRADRLSIYGKTRVRTPAMSAAFARAGVAFLHNQAASPSSPPSHGSIQTGMIPRVHGVSGDKGQIVPGTPTISTQLGAAGFATAYYGNNPFGMARLEGPGKWTEFHQPNQEGKGIDCTVLMQEMLGFATRQAQTGKRFFVSSLPYEPHTPYRFHAGLSDHHHPGPWDPPVGKLVDGELLGKLTSGKLKLTDAQWNQLRALYDGEVEHMDACFAQLVAGLEKAGLADDTLIVLTADHGEGMFEHGYMGHAFGHWGEVGNVPLVLYGKGLPAGMKIDLVTSHLDIVPTILELTGSKVDPRVQGRSLVPILRRAGQVFPRVVSLEYGRSYALRARDFRYIVDYQGKELLYDLRRDPGEQKSLVEGASAGALAPSAELPLRYLRDLAGLFLAHRSDWRAASWGDLNNPGPGFAARAASTN